MRDFLLILRLEKRTIIYGLVVCFVLIFPFTFMPTLIEFGFDFAAIRARWLTSTVYAFTFSSIIVVLATVYNYDNLVIKKWYFDQPAFEALNFSGGVSGTGSIVAELETVLIGQIKGYYFRISLQNVETSNPTMKIIPLIRLSEKEEAIEQLIERDGFEVDLFFTQKSTVEYPEFGRCIGCQS